MTKDELVTGYIEFLEDKVIQYMDDVIELHKKLIEMEDLLNDSPIRKSVD